MSNLRLIGLIIGAAGLISTFLIYRGPKWRRSYFVFFSFFSLALIIITANPNSVNFLRDLLSLQQYQYGRLIALLIVSNIFLIFFTLYMMSSIGTSRLQFDKLIRNMSALSFEKEYDFKNRIKPIMVVIPAYNEEKNLEHLLHRIPTEIKNVNVGVLVIDDGSADRTKQIVESHGNLVISNIINRGGGAALRLGYDILKQAGGDICVTMDADGQHLPGEIEKLVLPILNNRYDFVIGSRILGYREKDSAVRIAGVRVFGTLISAMIGKKITDPSSGFRAFKMERLEAINLFEDQYHTSELIIEAVKKGLHIGEVPISILKRKHGKSKKGKDLIYAFHFARTIINAWWRR